MVKDDVNVVLTRERGRNDSLREWLPADASVSEVPLTTTKYFERDDVRAALERFASTPFRSIALTSERSAEYVELALDVSPDAALFVVGPATKRALITHGLRVDGEGVGGAESLAPLISGGPVLLLGASSMRDELGWALRAKGLEVVAVACYETLSRTLTSSDVATLGGADVVFIGAPSAWNVARDAVASDAWVVVPGATSAAAVLADHPRVIEGWGPPLRTRLAELFA